MLLRQTDKCCFWGGGNTENLSLDVFLSSDCFVLFPFYWLLMWWHHLFVQLLTLLSCCIESGGVPSQPSSLSLQSITLTAAWSILRACCSILWQENLSALLYGLLLHYCMELVMDLTLYSTPGSALQSNFSFQHWPRSGDNEVFLWLCWCHHISVCPSTPRAQLTGKQIIQNNGKDENWLQSTWSQFSLILLGLCFAYVSNWKWSASMLYILCFPFFTCVNYVLRSWWRHVAC